MDWNKAGVLLLLAGSLWSDIKNRKIHLWWLIMHMAVAVGILCVEGEAFWEALQSAIPGIALIMISRATHGRIGMGDALLTLVMGMYLGLWVCVSVLLAGLLLSAVFGVCRKMLRHVSLKKPIIFTPFLCVGFGVWWVCSLI